MCGILGKITFRGEHEDAAAFDHALGLLAHRGPDDRGAHHATIARARVSVGQTRLSILDLSPAGHQPMFSPRSGVFAVYNGEVYNFRELRAELENRGYAFTSECDTEVIVAAYDADPERFMQGFCGMFAVAICDPQRQRVTLVRDRLGIKPLYYYWDGRQLAFASEVTALAALPTLDLEVDREAIGEVLLRGYIAAPLAIYQQVRKLPPGGALILDLSAPRPVVTRYWNALDYYADPGAFGDDGDVVEAIRGTLTTAVRRRLISDVPLGAFLSGGVDSTLVVALMRQVHSGTVRTFTVGFTEKEWDEAPAARRIAEHLQTEHEEFYLSEENILEATRAAAEHYDEPLVDPSSVPTLALCRLTRGFVTVALSGDGGDELFWGYSRYAAAGLRRFEKSRVLPPALRRAAAAIMRRLSGTRLEVWGHLLGAADLVSFYLLPAPWKPWRYPRLLRANVTTDRVLEIGREVAARLPGADCPVLTGAIDLHSYLPDDILVKVDRASMAVALEARVPILDHHVVELAARIPSALKTAGGELKHLLKVLLADYVPRELWARPKQGFGVPLVRWFRTSLREWAHDELLDSGGNLHQWLEPAELRAMLADHQSGRVDASRLMWACLQIAGWDRRFSAIRRAATSLAGAVGR